MVAKRKVRSPEFKARVALAALQERRTVGELAGQFDIHSTQVHDWKKQLMPGAAELFVTAEPRRRWRSRPLSKQSCTNRSAGKRSMGREANGPRRRTSLPAAENKVFPYLLRDLAITRTNQVWSTDATYIPLRRGFMYLVAVIDWFSRYVLSWELSNSLDATFGLTALESALSLGRPEIFDTDLGKKGMRPQYVSQFEPRGQITSPKFFQNYF